MKRILIILFCLATGINMFAQKQKVYAEVIQSKGQRYVEIVINDAKSYYLIPGKGYDLSGLSSQGREIDKETYKSLAKKSITHEVSNKDPELIKIAENMQVSLYPTYEQKGVSGVETAHGTSQRSATLYKGEVVASLIPGVKCSTKMRYSEGTRLRLLRVKNAENANMIGLDIVCEIMRSRRSNIQGLEGELVVRPLYIIEKDGSRIRLEPEDIYRRGKNRMNVKFWTSWTMIMALIPGTGAKIKERDEFLLHIDN